MQKRLKNVVLTFSLGLNGLCIAVMIVAALPKSNAFLSFAAPEPGYVAAAAVTIFPADSPLIFSPVEITLQPGEKTCVQYSLFVAKKQHNILITALYDPGVIAVAQTGFGIEITALAAGETVMQSISNDGIINIAVITVIN